jgi:hypothetical protein
MKRILVVMFSISFLLLIGKYSKAGEPVPGAEIYVELEPDTEPIANMSADQNGEFSFQFPEGMPIPKKGTFKMVITPPKRKVSTMTPALKSKIPQMQKQTIEVNFTSKEGPVFKYILKWDDEGTSKTQNRGSFAVSGKSST